MGGLDPGRAFYAGLLEALTNVMGSAKGYLRDHGPRAATMANRVGMELGLDDQACAELVFASVLCDMGMVGLAEDAWENPVAELSDDARRRVRQHPERSETRIREIPHLENLGALVRHHHEWWDGSGYPDGLGGDDIPLGAQILRLADTVAALGAPRPHRGAMAPGEILAVVQESEGREFGPDVAGAYVAMVSNGGASDFRADDYQALVMASVERLLPRKVSPPSTNQLLTIVANLIDAKDPYTAGHSRRVAVLAVALADQLGLTGEVKSALWAIGYLHDLGKLAVPLRVLAKEGRLTDEEFGFIRAHPTDGAEILEGIPTLRHLTEGVRYHHERWDGAGYPAGLWGDRIPLVAQVMAVCDAYDAMTSKRAYRDSVTPDRALAEVAREKGGQFGPVVADGFLSIPGDIFAGLQVPRPDELREMPRRAGILRHADPRWFKSGPARVG